MLSWQRHSVALTIYELGDAPLFGASPDRARSLPREMLPSEARRKGCKGRICTCATTLPSGSFLACHLPLHRGGYIEEALASHSLGSAREAPPRSRFLPTMAKTSVRRARTPHRGDAYHARLTPLHRGGKETNKERPTLFFAQF